MSAFRRRVHAPVDQSCDRIGSTNFSTSFSFSGRLFHIA